MTKSTKQAKRTENLIFTISGSKKIATILPGKNGVTQIDIEILHSEDDQEVDEGRRYDYRIACNLESYVDENGDSKAEHNKLLADWDADPFNEILEMENCEEKQKLIEQLHKAMGQLTDKQFRTIQKKFYEQKTNVEIAAEEDVTEAAIRNRLNKIYRRLEKLISKGS
ncbi:sigma-70 family RNA polymerase sigma factor [Paracerasibacillus soli]|uniref:Sigma-70 family RNA polymerase sigma factor n=1 Tax=Paracerasibacillus soli TaxID=480284 RepID=A0ABU5CW74_9BACI|nr:sigma-70 family RNA polymerase sigma factor [Virgibacillus soli]MDY0410623.1 sigma-70 family RNA polymerase sigma factor [Virgibacillus soli]